MILRVKFRDRDGQAGAPGRRAERVELEAECAADLEALGELFTLLSTRGATTAGAVRELCDRAKPPAATGEECGRGYG